MDHTVDPDAQLKGYKYKEVDYTFSNGNFSSSIDVNGQLVHGISYYPNNQPRSISVQGGGESYSYTLSGMKFKQERQELVDGQIETEERYYIGGVEFVDGVMQTFYFPDGRMVLDKESKEIFAQYKIKDHLGNTAVVFQDKDLDDVVIDEEAADAFNLELEVLQRDFYYPFGLSMEGAWIAGSTDDPRMDYRYNGKELSQVTGLYAYGARYYDPTIGRFTGVDPIADQFAFVSPFNYAENEPIAHIDLWGLQKFYAGNGVYLGQFDGSDELRLIASAYSNAAAVAKEGAKNSSKNQYVLPYLMENSTKLYMQEELNSVYDDFAKKYKNTTSGEYAMAVWEGSFTDESGTSFKGYQLGKTVYKKKSGMGGANVPISDSTIPSSHSSNWERYSAIHNHPFGAVDNFSGIDNLARGGPRYGFYDTNDLGWAIKNKAYISLVVGSSNEIATFNPFEYKENIGSYKNDAYFRNRIIRRAISYRTIGE